MQTILLLTSCIISTEISFNLDEPNYIPTEDQEAAMEKEMPINQEILRLVSRSHHLDLKSLKKLMNVNKNTRTDETFIDSLTETIKKAKDFTFQGIFSKIKVGYIDRPGDLLDLTVNLEDYTISFDW